MRAFRDIGQAGADDGWAATGTVRTDRYSEVDEPDLAWLDKRAHLRSLVSAVTPSHSPSSAT
jgi:hypothetical protein